MFCVKCGAEDVEIIDGLCIDCFLNGRKLLSMPHHVNLFRCTNCEEWSINDDWVKMSQDEAIVQIALTQLAVIPEAKVISVGPAIEKQDDRTYVVHIQVDMDVKGFQASEETSIIVRLKNNVCKRCSRQLGSYYESIIQLRTGEKTLDDDVRDEIVRWIRDSVEAQAKTNRSLFITKVEPVTGGIDFYLSSISLGKSLTHTLYERYAAEVKESAKLITTSSDGLEVYRVTYLVRLPHYHVGDVLRYNNKPCQLILINKTGGKLADLNTFREFSVKKSELLDTKVLVKRSELKSAVVVSKSVGEIQVLHPTTYQTLDLKIPKDADIGESVLVADVDDQLYYIVQQ